MNPSDYNFARRKSSTFSIKDPQSKRLSHLMNRNLLATESEQELSGNQHFTFDVDALRAGAPLNDLFTPGYEDPPVDFRKVVDQDESHIQDFVSNVLVGKLVDSSPFKIFIFLIIVVNCVLIALNLEPQYQQTFWQTFNIFDQVVLAIFVFELVLKWYYAFWIFWKDSWNVLDFIVVFVLIVGPQFNFLSSSRGLRLLRVLRALRSLQNVGALRGLDLAIQALRKSAPDMANICLLLLILLLVFGVIGVSLFSLQMPRDFGTLQHAMFSMFVCVTEDGWVSILKRFRDEGTALYVLGALYLCAAVIIGAFVFANLVVAVIVTNLETAIKENTLEGESMNVVNLKSFQPFVDFSKQTPMEKANLKHVNAKKLEKYYFVLSALEDNLQTYLSLRRDLVKIFKSIHKLNIGENEYADVMKTRSTATVSQLSSALLSWTASGDVLTNLITLQQQGVLDVGETSHNVKEVIRSARKIKK